jgi:hypothetical protein
MRADVPVPRSPEQMTEVSRTPSEWEAIGEAMETMGKIGLAMTVGFTAAALFCRLADQKKLKTSAVKKVIEQLA